MITVGMLGFIIGTKNNMKIYSFIFLLVIFVQKNQAQNLILNPSFSDVKEKNNKNKPYKISTITQSDVKNWYVPAYIYNLNIKFPYKFAYYYSSRDKVLIPKDRKTQFVTNGEQLFENNLGFIYIGIMRNYSLSLIQQRMNQPLKRGNYCFKFKYKFDKYGSSHRVRPVSLDFAFSQTDLKEYYKKTLSIPDSLIKVSFKDTINEFEFNAPWLQQCYKIYLNGDEQFLSIGTLANKDPFPWGTFFIDDIELYPINDVETCSCLELNRDLRRIYHKDFPLNTVTKNDTMVCFRPSGDVGSGIITPEAKETLHSIIAFMQRNPTINIKFLVFDKFYFENSKYPNRFIDVGCSYLFTRYLAFFGINKNRIKAESVECKDETGFYCKQTSEFEQIGFEFYNE